MADRQKTARGRHFNQNESVFGASGLGHDLLAYGDTVGQYIYWDASAGTFTVAGTFAYSGTFAYTLGAADTITFDAGTTDHTGASVLVFNLDVNSASVNMINATIDIGTALSGGEIVKGSYFDINEVVLCADTSGILGYDVLMTGFATGRADLTGYKVAFDGTKNGGDVTKGLIIDCDQTINNAGEYLYGVHVDMSGLTQTNGIVYGQYIDVSQVVSSGTAYGSYYKVSATTTSAIYIDASTDKTAGNIIDINLDVNAAAITMINATIDIGTLLDAGEYVRGTYLDVNEVVVCADTSGIFVHDVLMTPFATGRADMIGYRVTVDGSKTTADTVTGFSVVGTTTVNTSTLYGQHINFSGITHTAGTVYGQYIDVSAAVAGGSAYGSYYLCSAAATAITIDAGTTQHTGASVIDINLDVNSASVNLINATIDIDVLLTAAEEVKGSYFAITEAVVNEDTSLVRAYDTLITSFATGRADLTGYNVNLAGSKTTADTVKGFAVNGALTVNTATLYGQHIDLSGITHTAGTTYGQYIDVSATVTAGSMYGTYYKLAAAATAIHIDAATIDKTIGNIINIDVDVDSAAVTLINATVDVGVLLSAGEIVKGVYFDIDETLVNADTSGMIGFDTTITGISTSRADLIGYRVTLDGTKDGGDTTKGFTTVGTVTINNAGEYLYGTHIDFSGITQTNGIVYGSYIDVSAAITAGTGYGTYYKLSTGATAIYIDAGTNDHLVGNIIDVNLDVDSAAVTLLNATIDIGTLLSGTEIVRGVYLDINEAVICADTSGITAFDTIITGFTAGRADLTGYKVTFDGTKSGADTVQGLWVVGTLTVNTATLYGTLIDFSGITDTAGAVYGQYIDVSTTVAAGTAYGTYYKVGAATTAAIYIDAGTVDKTAGNIIDVNLDVNAAAINLINATIDVITLLDAAEYVKGCYFDINETVACADTSAIVAYDTLITPFATGRADIIGYRVSVDGSKTTADTITGFTVVGTNTVNTATMYGAHINLSGITHTAGTVYGSYIDVSAAVTAGSAYGTYYKLAAATTAIYIDAATNDKTVGDIITVDVDVNSAAVNVIRSTIDIGTILTAGEIVRGCYFDMNESVVNENGSQLIAYDTVITGLSTSRNDIIAYYVLFDGTRDQVDSTEGLSVGGTVTLGGGHVLYGTHVDFSSVTQTNGVVYGSYINVAQTVSGGSTYAEYIKLSAAAKGIYIDAGTIDHTGTNIISCDLDVNSASVNGIEFDIDVGTALSTGETVNGLSIDIDGNAGDHAASIMNGIFLTSANTTTGINTAIHIDGTFDYAMQVASTAGRMDIDVEIDNRGMYEVFDDFNYQTITEADTVWILNNLNHADPAINAQQWGVMRCSTPGTLDGNGSEIVSSKLFHADSGSLVYECRIKIDNITTCCINAGFFDTTAWQLSGSIGAGDAITTTAVDGCFWVYDTGADTDKWCLVGVDTNTDATGIAVSAVAPVNGTYTVLRIEISADGENAKGYIDGVLCGTLTLNATSEDVALYPGVVIVERAGAARNLDVDYIYAASKRI